MDRKQLYKDYIIIVDSKSVMTKSFSLFLEDYLQNHTPDLKHYLMLTWETLKIVQNEYNTSRKERLGNLLLTLAKNSADGYVKVTKVLPQDFEAEYPEETAISMFIIDNGDKNIILITELEELAQSCYRSCIKSKSVHRAGKLALTHFKDNDNGDLDSWDESLFEKKLEASKTTSSNQRSKRAPRTRTIKPTYTMATQRLPLTTIPNTKITVTKSPQVGDEIKFRGVKTAQPILLKKILGAGGEATIYTTNTQFVVKVFKPEFWTMWRLKKIESLVAQKYYKRKRFDSVAFPVTVVENTLGEPIGYSMIKGMGTPLELLYSSEELKEKFPDWTRVELAKLCVTILKVIESIHEEGIIIGDINDRNILVQDENNVFFVDTDSYQLGDIPSGVGTPEYTAPELLRASKSVDYSKFLKLATDDYFAAATLLFKILMRGNYPYSRKKGGTIVQNMREMDFAYPVGKRVEDSAMPLENDCIYMWSDLTYSCKKAFADVFAKTLVVKDNATGKEKEVLNEGIKPENRHTIKDWLKIMSANRDYLGVFKSEYEKYVVSKGGGPLSFEEVSLAIAKGELKQDPEVLNIFPAPHTKRTEGQYAYKCAKCGTITSIEYEVWKKRRDLFTHCPSCSKQIVTKKVCKVPNCNTEFEITLAQQQAFVRKGLVPPTRCPFHRGGKNNTGIEACIQFNNDTNDSSNSGSSKCFLTTATCVFFGKPDNCEELQALREFRDTWLAKQPKGLSLIADYYAVAPKIVEGIAKSGNAEQEYHDMYYKYIVPCMNAVHEKAFSKCNELYMTMYKDLKKRYYDGPQLKFDVKVKSLKELDEIFNSKRVAEIMTVIKEDEVVQEFSDEDLPPNLLEIVPVIVKTAVSEVQEAMRKKFLEGTVWVV